MPIEVLKLDDYRITSSDIFFLDNNIWMYLLCPTGNHNLTKQEKYSKFFSYLLSRDAPIFVTSMVISEFSHRSLKLDFDIEKGKPENAGKYRDFKKDYLTSERGAFIREQIGIASNKILSFCRKSPDNFNSLDLKSVLTLGTKIGFNDSYFLHLSQKSNWKIVTDDTDFGKKINDPTFKNLIPQSTIKVITGSN